MDARVVDHLATRRRRVWVTATAAALVIAGSVGITAIRLYDTRGVHDVPGPTTVATSTSTPSTSSTLPEAITPAPQPRNLRGQQRSSSVGALDDIYAIDLDPWLEGAPTWSATDRDGPYLTFDIQHLPAGWSVTSVEGSHPLGSGPAQYQWIVQLSSTESIDAMLRVDSFGFSYPVDGAPTTIRGREGKESITNGSATITWMEAGSVQVRLTSSTLTALPQLHTLSESLQQVFVDSIGPAPAWPPPNTVSFDVGQPEMSGSINGHPWTVDTGDESATRALMPRVDGVLLQGIDTRSDDPPPGYQIGITTTAVIGGVMVLAVLPPEVDHAVAHLSDGATIVMPGYHWFDRTGIVVPIPHGLDVTAVDFAAADDTPLQRIEIPEYPPIVSGASTTYGADLVPPPPAGTPRDPH